MAADSANRAPDRKPARGSAPDSVQRRLAALERALTEQQERIAQQERMIEKLRAGQPGAQEAIEVRMQPGAQPAPSARRPSRRSLLKVGGVAAAAAAIATAGAATRAPEARAAGVGWQTGTVLADTETVVKPSSVGYPSNDLLQLQLGTGTPFNPLTSPMKAALAAYDTTTDSIGVYGTSQAGYGLYGVTETGTGASGAGLNGSATGSGTGVAGQSASGIGVQGSSAGGVGGSFAGGQAPVVLSPDTFVGPPTSGVHVIGEIHQDSHGTLWICNQSGDFATSTHPVFYPLSGIVLLAAPVRVVGATTTYGGLPGVQINANAIYTFGVDAYVPAYAKAMLGNATCHSMPGAGHLDLWPAGVARPNASTVNYVPADVPLSNFCIIGLNASGSSKRAFSVASYQTCGFLYDLTGYIV